MKTERLSYEQAMKNRIEGMRRAKRIKKVERTGCVAGVNFCPLQPCEQGRTGVCCWGIDSEEYDFCTFSFIDAHPGGALFKEIAEVLGISKQGVQLIEAKAIAKLQKRIRDQHPDVEEAWDIKQSPQHAAALTKE